MRDGEANRPGEEHADANDAGATGVGSQDHAPSEDLEAAMRRADERGEPAAPTELGLILERRGDLAGAEAAYRRADERGDAMGARNLGRVLEQQGDPAGAKAAYHRAYELGDAHGALNLGRLLAEQGDLPAAAVAYRRADKGGEPAGASSLGRLLEQLGDPVGAAAAYRRACDRGHAAGAVHLGRLLASNGELTGAEAAYRRASELGDDDGAVQLAKLHAERGEPASGRPGVEGASSGEHDVAGRLRDGKRRHGSVRWYLRRRFRAGAATSAASEAEQAPASDPAALEPESAAVEPESAVPESAVPEPAVGGPELAVVDPEPAVVDPEPAVVDPEPATPEPVSVEPEPALPTADPVRAHRVMALQRQLAALGFDPGPIDGRFGPRTTGAVKYLQEMSGLEPDGIVGPLTAEVLRHSAPEAPSDERAQLVQTLQRQLGWLGFEPGRADGQYGPLTTGAVKRFQEANDLPADGIVDRATADALRASIAQRPSSDRIDRVKALQRQLHWLGFEPGAIDGRYGPQTTEAVRRFQAAHDLPGDGIVEHATRRALEEAVQRTGQW